MTIAATAPPERPVCFLAPLVEPARTGFESADGVAATIAGMVTLPNRGPWKLGPLLCVVVVLGVNMLVVAAGGDDDDDVVSDGLITAGSVGVGTRLKDDRPLEMVGITTTGETCTAVVMVGGPCIPEGDEGTSVVSTGATWGRTVLGPSPSSCS